MGIYDLYISCVLSTFSTSGPLFTKQTDILPQDLVKPRSREIGCYNDGICLKFDRHLGRAAAEVPVKFQSDWKSLNPNLAASRLHEMSYHLVNRGPGYWYVYEIWHRSVVIVTNYDQYLWSCNPSFLGTKKFADVRFPLLTWIKFNPSMNK